MKFFVDKSIGINFLRLIRKSRNILIENGLTDALKNIEIYGYYNIH